MKKILIAIAVSALSAVSAFATTPAPKLSETVTFDLFVTPYVNIDSVTTPNFQTADGLAIHLSGVPGNSSVVAGVTVSGNTPFSCGINGDTLFTNAAGDTLPTTFGGNFNTLVPVSGATFPVGAAATVEDTALFGAYQATATVACW